jgi:hypothetical protein
MKLVFDGKAFISDSAIFILETDYPKDKYILYVINGKKYKQMIEPNSNNLIETKQDEELQEALEEIRINDPKTYEIKVLKTFKAYKKYGFEGLSGGVIEITKR